MQFFFSDKIFEFLFFIPQIIFLVDNAFTYLTISFHSSYLDLL